jgi:broad specificity phosphatase PhoE
VAFDRAYSGLRARQLDTARIVSEAYRGRAVAFPEVVIMSEFDEYQASAVFRECLPQLLPAHPEIRELRRAYDTSRVGSDLGERHKAFGRLFEAVIAKWVAEQVTAPGIESWQEFCARIERGLTRVINDTPSASTAVIFTSAGAIGAAVRRALHLSAEDALQITWMSRNASFTSFLASGERFTLSAFNAHPHLEGDGLLTYR